MNCKLKKIMYFIPLITLCNNVFAYSATYGVTDKYEIGWDLAIIFLKGVLSYSPYILMVLFALWLIRRLLTRK